MKFRRRHPRTRLRPLVGSSLAFCLFLCPSPAEARKRGFADGICEGCHGAADNASLSASPLIATPGETITFQIVLSDSDAEVGGLFVQTDDLAGVSIPGDQTIVVVNNGVTHTAPTAFSNGSVTFSLSYQVPSTPGATQFSVWAVAANGNDEPTGDEVNQQTFGLVYGCEPQTYYADNDRDGHGQAAPTRTACAGAAPVGFAEAPDDCDDNDGVENPSAVELCNGEDDNCNGEADEGAVPVELFPDADGDGYYSYAEWQNGDSVIGCLPYPGYAAKAGDCEANAANAHPGGEEVCDLRLDEDCDGSVDERVKPYCGEGACQRMSQGCTVEDCIPGEPAEEVCNFVDDDCDGDQDEGDLCPSGQECSAGACREVGSIPAPNPGDPDPGDPSDPDNPDPGTTDPGTTDPGTTDPGTDATPKGAPKSSGSCAVLRAGASRPSNAPPWLTLWLLVAGILGRRRRLS